MRSEPPPLPFPRAVPPPLATAVSLDAGGIAITMGTSTTKNVAMRFFYAGSIDRPSA